MPNGFLQRAFGYQGDAMNLPVSDVAASAPFYESKMGFRAVSRSEAAPRSVVFVRDEVQLRLVENGGDPTQDGCAFHVAHLEALLLEFQGNGLNISEIKEEQHDGVTWRVFYVVAPDGLCYWFGEKP